MIDILIVDDHPVIRAGIRAILDQYPDLRVADEAQNGEEAVAFATSSGIDIVLMDLNLGPGTSGVEATRQIRELDPTARVLVLTNIEDETNIVNAIEAGAVGYILKDAEPDDLAQAIRRTMQGHGVLAPSVTNTLLTHSRRPSDQRLTSRELQILRLVANGHSNRNIAQELVITEATVKAHLTRTFTKLGVTSRTAAVATAREVGVL